MSTNRDLEPGNPEAFASDNDLVSLARSIDSLSSSAVMGQVANRVLLGTPNVHTRPAYDDIGAVNAQEVGTEYVFEWVSMCGGVDEVMPVVGLRTRILFGVTPEGEVLDVAKLVTCHDVDSNGLVSLTRESLYASNKAVFDEGLLGLTATVTQDELLTMQQILSQ